MFQRILDQIAQQDCYRVRIGCHHRLVLIPIVEADCVASRRNDLAQQKPQDEDQIRWAAPEAQACLRARKLQQTLDTATEAVEKRQRSPGFGRMT